MTDAKFIVVQDTNIANKLISAGFQLVTHVNNTYTFVNVVPNHFNFDNINIKKLAYTNMLAF